MPRIAALVLAYLFLALAVIGVFIPGLPTVPFLLLTAWFAAKGSERLHNWLYAHPLFGKLLADWESKGAISRTSKIIAVTMLIVSWFVMKALSVHSWILVGVAILFITVSCYLISRPEPD